MTPEEIKDRESVWERVSRTEWSFSPEMDVTNNYHMVREIVLGQSVAWGEVNRRYKPQPGHNIMDIGANVGIYSAWAASRGAIVLAYEPDPKALTFLRQAAKIAGFMVAPFAVVGSTSDQSILYYGKSEKIGSTDFYNGGTQNIVPWSDKEMSYAVSVDTVPFAQAIQYMDWDFVKIDIEGREVDLIFNTPIGAFEYIRRCYMEIHPWISDDDYNLMMSIMKACWKVDILTTEPDRPHRADAVYLERPE